MTTQASAETSGLERLVRSLDQQGQPTGELRPFSTFLSQRNLILLGDPGAGKSHLFRAASYNSEITARHFCLAPIAELREREAIFIDGLDEKRSGRGDTASVDEIVRRLVEVAPAAVRLSCRAADWLGPSDLGALNVYFNAHGGVTLLALEPLNEQSITELLRTRGLADSAAFIEQAEQRGLRELLGNPQNLQMLAEVVKDSGWPTSRRELFDRAVELLLTEHDKEHRRKNTFTAKELLLPAGAACAARLLADVEGISLLSVSTDANYPSYRDIGIFEHERVESALRRRAFVRLPQFESVGYVHRLIAEYLAANFLADRIRSGALPFGRVQRMLCVDDRPTSELRGLCAWLATLLPAHATKLIRGDPFGVLVYGDASALSASHRGELLAGLSELSEKNPWFRGSQWSTSTLGALATEDMTEALRGILKAPDPSRSLLIVVLDALRISTPSATLLAELSALLRDTTERHSVRWRAFEALMAMGVTAHAEVLSIYRSVSQTHSELATRAKMLEGLHAAQLVGASDIAAFINDASTSGENDRHFSLFKLGQTISPQLASDALDLIRFAVTEGIESAIARQAFQLIEQLFTRCVHAVNISTAGALVRRLARRVKQARYRTSGDTSLHDALVQSPLLHALIFIAIDRVDEKEGWLCFVRINEILANAASADAVLQCMLERIRTNQFTSRDYAIALHCVMYYPEKRDTFEQLFSLADERRELQDIRTTYISASIPDYHWEHAKHRSESSAQKRASQLKNQQSFDKQRLKIIAGLHLNWLGHLAEYYFGRFMDVEQNAPPLDRLIKYYGEDRTRDSVEGFIALVERGHHSSIRQILSMHSNDRYYPWWFAMLAGLDQFVAHNGQLNTVPVEFLDSAFVINILHHTFESGNSSATHRGSWVKWFVTQHPGRACDLLEKIIRTDLASRREFVNGMNELLHAVPELQAHRAPCVDRLLIEYPSMNAQYLRQLLQSLSAAPDITSTIWAGLRAVTFGDQHKLWLAKGLITDFLAFQPEAELILEADAQRELVVSCMSMLAIHDRDDALARLPLSLTEFLLRRLFKLRHVAFGENEDHHHIDRDATEFTYGLLNRVSANVDDSSRTLLERCLVNPDAHSYREHIKYCLAQQEVHRIDALYRQPSWPEALQVLSSGEPISVADLHALVLTHLEDIRDDIRTDNIDIFQGFWNEDPKTGKVASPKHENAGTKVLIGILRSRLGHLGIKVEPEAHMVNDNRADIGIYYRDMKLVVEMKRHYHNELWTAATEQLDRFYTKHRGAQGFGILGVYWYGIELAPPPVTNARVLQAPTSATELHASLTSLIPAGSRARIPCVIFDVSDAKADETARKQRKTSKRPRRRSAT